MENPRFKIREEVIRHESEIERAGVGWRLLVNNISDGITVSLKEVQEKDFSKRFLLDYQFIDLSIARLHMMPGAGENVTTAEKLSRLALWGKAIQAYDSIMTLEVQKELTMETIQELLKRDTIPRIAKVVAPTGNPTLQTLLSRFSSFEQNENDGMRVAWPELVAVAKREKWLL